MKKTYCQLNEGLNGHATTWIVKDKEDEYTPCGCGSPSPEITPGMTLNDVFREYKAVLQANCTGIAKL